MKLIKMKCENCGATLEVNKDLDKIKCNFCGAEILIDDEAAELRRVEEVKLKARKENHEQSLKEKKELEEIEAVDKFKKSKLSKFVIVFTILCLLFVITAFNDGKTASGIVGIIQIVCFSIGWLSGMQIIKEKFKEMHTIFIIIGFALIIPFFAIPSNLGGYSPSSNSSDCEKIDWETINLNKYIPEYNKAIGDISINSDNSLSITLCKVSKTDYRAYVKKVREFGYNVDSMDLDESFRASSNNGYKLSLTWYDDKELDIMLSKTTESNNNPSEESKQEETKKEEPKNNTSTDELRSDFKKAMDNYEKYMDEYVTFMKKYNSNPSDYELLKEYNKVMKKYKEAMESFENWESKDLNDAETKYYIEVQTRVNEKLASIA